LVSYWIWLPIDRFWPILPVNRNHATGRPGPTDVVIARSGLVFGRRPGADVGDRASLFRE
jgi:hypothetical protein